MRRLILLLPVLFVIARPVAAAPDSDLGPRLRAALVKVHVTTQSWNGASPWNKDRPRSTWQRGVVVRPGLVLTLAVNLSDQLMIEVSEANSSRTYAASLAHIDYSANLALVSIDDKDLLARTAPLELGNPITIDAEFDLWYLDGGDLLKRGEGLVKAVAPSGVRLELTVKTNLSEGGNGQVALRDGRVAGLLLTNIASRQEGQLLSVETMRHFLDDFDTGEYRGFGAGGLWMHELLRDDLRTWFGVPAERHGIVVSRVVPGRTGDGVLREGDVILRLRDYDLDDEGMFLHPLHGRLDYRYLLLGAVHPGDRVPARILREGEVQEVEIPIRAVPPDEQRVPYDNRDRRPHYMVVGGLVILELTQSTRVGSSLLGKVQERADWDPPGERKRIVFASRLLADPANKGQESIQFMTILTVNGKKITRIADVAAALAEKKEGFHVITFEDIEKPFVVAAADLSEIDLRIAERYRIPELRFLGED